MRAWVIAVPDKCADKSIFVVGVGVVDMQLPRRCLIVSICAAEMAKTLNVHMGNSDGSVGGVLGYSGCEAKGSSSD